MAKQTAIQMVNKVLSNLGEQSVAALSSLSGLSLLVFNTLNEVLYDLAFEYKYKPLETTGTFTLTSNVGTYAKPTNLYEIDRKSFRYDESDHLEYYTPQRFDAEFVTQTDTGTPILITEWGSFFRPYYIPENSVDTKEVKYRYWQLPTVYDTATETGTSWIPEGFDLTLLADMVTYKILHYKQNAEANVYYVKVWGDGRENEGRLSKFRDLYGSPEIEDGSIVTEGMERKRSRRRRYFEPITG